MATAANPFFVNAGSTTDQKAADYSRLLSSGMNDLQIRDAANNFFGQQTDADWSYLQNLAQQPNASPSGQAPYQSALIESLRAASPGFGSNNPGVTMLANPANSKTVIDFKRTPIQPYLPPGPVVGPPGPVVGPPGPVVGPPEPPPAGGGGNGTGPIVIGPGPDVGPVTPLPQIDVVPSDDFVGPMPDDFVGPMPDDFVGPMPDDFVGPPAPDDDGAKTFPVPDPAPPDARDLPPLPGEADPDPNGDFVGPMPDDFVGPMSDDFVEPPAPPGGDDDFVGPMPDDFVGPMPYFPSEDDFVGPMPDDFVGPPAPEPVDPPEGEIEVGPPGDSQPARDAIDQIGDITELGDPLDELGDIELPIPDIAPPDIPPPEPETPSDAGGPPGGSGDFYVPPRDLISVSPDPLDEWEWIEPDIPEIPLPEIPAANFGNFNFSDAELLDMLLSDFGYGGGGGGMPFSDMVMLSQE